MLLIGQVVTDVSYPADPNRIKMRLGGIIHAARMAWATDIPFRVAFIAPEYVVDAVADYLAALGSQTSWCIGTVHGAPNVLLIPDPLEAGSQGYQWVLGGQHSISIDEVSLAQALGADDEDILLFPDASDVAGLQEAWVEPGDSRAVHVDTALAPDAVSFLAATTYITSTSTFDRGTNPRQLAAEAFNEGFKQVLLKENRGGSRLFTPTEDFQADAHLGPIVHSVGVGDAFDVAFVNWSRICDPREAMALSSLLATNYASTTDPDVLRRLAQATVALGPRNVGAMTGCFVRWEDRPSVSIYIAAPDFDWADTSLLDQLETALRYHNFTPRRPVKENGQVEVTDSRAVAEAFVADMELLTGARLVIAVRLFNDTGTLLEAGWAAGRGIPVVMWDPSGTFDNVWLAELPSRRATTLEEVVRQVFSLVGTDA